MRPSHVAVVVFTASLLISSCVMVGDTPVTGGMLAISRADLHEVVAAYRAVPNRAHSKIYRIEVVGRDEVHLFGPILEATTL
jgi:hypothetical protein